MQAEWLFEDKLEEQLDGLRAAIEHRERSEQVKGLLNACLDRGADAGASVVLERMKDALDYDISDPDFDAWEAYAEASNVLYWLAQQFNTRQAMKLAGQGMDIEEARNALSGGRGLDSEGDSAPA